MRRDEVALHILNAMIASPPEGSVVNWFDADKKLWTQIAFIWADEFLKQARGDD